MRDRLEVAVVKAMADWDGKLIERGRDDCFMGFSNIVRDALGYDPLAEFRGKYATIDEGISLIGRLGFAFAFRKIAARHGWKRIDPADAQVGDPALAMIPISDGRRLVTPLVYRARGLFLVRNETAFSALPARHARLCWSLG